jgi:hypothetical protein
MEEKEKRLELIEYIIQSTGNDRSYVEQMPIEKLQNLKSKIESDGHPNNAEPHYERISNVVDYERTLKERPVYYKRDLEELRRLKQELQTEKPDSERYQTLNNIICDYENELRIDCGLKPKPKPLTDTQLEIILELDNWQLGSNSQELLSMFKGDDIPPEQKYLHEHYKNRLVEMIHLKTSEIQRAEREEQSYKKLLSDVQALGKMPKKLLPKDKYTFVRNPAFDDYEKALSELHTRVRNKLRSIKGIPPFLSLCLKSGFELHCMV